METVKTVPKDYKRFFTGLKPGVNEKDFRGKLTNPDSPRTPHLSPNHS